MFHSGQIDISWITVKNLGVMDNRFVLVRDSLKVLIYKPLKIGLMNHIFVGLNGTQASLHFSIYFLSSRGDDINS